MMLTRPAVAADVPHFQDIERAAGAIFRSIDMTAVADDPPMPLAVLMAYQRDGRAWVAACASAPSLPVGYLLLDIVDESAHVEQVSVHPAHAGKRLGSALLDAASYWAEQQRLTTVTLTTFTDVAWNGPYYLRLGFTHVPDDEVGAGLSRVREAEAAHGLDRWPRCVMRRPAGWGQARPDESRTSHSSSEG